MGQNHKHEHVSKRLLHKDWRVWTALALMLAAMLVYVLSDDESLQLGGPPQQPMPAAAGL
jgi:hypothetical protein